MVDSGGTVQYEQVAHHPGDRTHGNDVRYVIRDGFEDSFGGQRPSPASHTGYPPESAPRPVFV